MEAAKAWAWRWLVELPGSLFDWGGKKGLEFLLRLGELLLLAAAFIWIGAKTPNDFLLYLGAALIAAGSAWVAVLVADLICQKPERSRYRQPILLIVGVASLVASQTILFRSLLDLANAQFGG